MKQKSLRQQAKELGVSHSYLSQVLHGKRPASNRVAQALNGKQVVSNCEATMGLKIRFLQGSVGSSPSLGSASTSRKRSQESEYSFTICRIPCSCHRRPA
jgi:transcriptional regulator with XRE-family HTH domain